jgi:hypothetical protein
LEKKSFLEWKLDDEMYILIELKLAAGTPNLVTIR